MPREIVWLPDAVTDLHRLREFIQQENPQAAQRAANRIKEAVQILELNPEAGRPVEKAIPFRDLIIPFGGGNYVLRYREDSNRLIVVRIRHNRERGF